MLSAPVYSKVHRRTKRFAGCRTGKETKTPQCTTRPAGYGFLKTRFLPVREDKYPVLRNRIPIEREFFASLSNFAALYGFTVPDVSGQPYPLNIATAYRQAKEHFSLCNGDLQLIIIQNDIHTASIATTDTYSVGNKLYYIPVRPLFDLLHSKKSKQVSGLLLAVFSYLHHIAGIPWFENSSSYLCSCYEVLREWYMDDTDPTEQEATTEAIAKFDQMEKGGRMIYKKMKNAIHLTDFEKRIRQFKPVTKSEENVLRVATDAFQLMQNYPQRTIFSSIPENLFDAEVEERIMPEHYLSFFWDSEDFLYDHLIEYVNSYLQECSVMDEPVSFQFFNKPQDRPFHDLNFERELFNLIDDLCTVLNQLT